MEVVGKFGDFDDSQTHHLSVHHQQAVPGIAVSQLFAREAVEKC